MFFFKVCFFFCVFFEGVFLRVFLISGVFLKVCFFVCVCFLKKKEFFFLRCVF